MIEYPYNYFLTKKSISLLKIQNIPNIFDLSMKKYESILNIYKTDIDDYKKTNKLKNSDLERFKTLEKISDECFNYLLLKYKRIEEFVKKFIYYKHENNVNIKNIKNFLILTDILNINAINKYDLKFKYENPINYNNIRFGNVDRLYFKEKIDKNSIFNRITNLNM